MTRRKRLATLLELARNRATEEARALAVDRQSFEECQNRLEVLRAFRGDYDDQSRDVDGQIIGAIHLKARYQLVGHLDGALAEAERVTEAARQRVLTSEVRWRERRTRSGALEKALDRVAAEDARERRRREQRRLDENVGFIDALRKQTS